MRFRENHLQVFYFLFIYFSSPSILEKILKNTFGVLGASLVAQMVKNLPAIQETWVRSLGREDPLEKGMATHCSILAWRIPWTEQPWALQSMGLQRVEHDLVIKQHR